MRNILLAELRYNMLIWAVMSMVTIVITAVQIKAPEGDLPLHMILFFVPLYGAVVWTVGRNREKRDLQTVRLPIAAWKAETARICIVCLIGWSQIGINILLRVTAGAFSAAGLLPLLTIWGLYYIMLMLKFSLRSYFLYFIRFNRWFSVSRERSMRILVVFSAMINIYLVYLFLERKTGTEAVLLRVIGYFKNPVPFTGQFGGFIFTGCCLVVAAITVYGYQRRRSFLI
ncbi:hypothetical protein JXO52_00695 [bacterium]|nr:hypothetical protein [bacterium]